MKYVLLLALTVAVQAHALETKMTGESEASSVVLSGNNNVETYSAKTKNTFPMSEVDLATVFGKYLRSVVANTETTKSWEAGLRYERIFTKDLFSGFLQHKAEHDPYNGIFIQRDSTDIGVKYVFTKNEYLQWFGELGYRYSSTFLGSAVDREKANFIRVYTEAEYKFMPTLSAKIWLEHLANLTKPSEPQSNAELSVAATLSERFRNKMLNLF